jgi:hypothetical protein
MIFLIEYDRRRGKLVTFRSFEDSEREQAQDARLELELDLHRQKVEREVVILEATSEEIIRSTHGRYFYNLSELMARFKDALPAA